MINSPVRGSCAKEIALLMQGVRGQNGQSGWRSWKGNRTESLITSGYDQGLQESISEQNLQP